MKLSPAIAKLPQSLRKCSNCVFAQGTRNINELFCRSQRCNVLRYGDRICKDFAPVQTKVI